MKSHKHLNSLDSHPFRNCFVFAIIFFLCSSNGKGCLWMKVHSTEKIHNCQYTNKMNVIKYQENRKHTSWEHAIKLRAVILKPVSRRTYRVWIIITREIKKQPTDWLSLCRTLMKPRQTSPELFVVSIYTVEPLQNGLIGDRRNWPLWRGGRYGEKRV